LIKSTEVKLDNFICFFWHTRQGLWMTAREERSHDDNIMKRCLSKLCLRGYKKFFSFLLRCIKNKRTLCNHFAIAWQVYSFLFTHLRCAMCCKISKVSWKLFYKLNFKLIFYQIRCGHQFYLSWCSFEGFGFLQD